MFVCLSGRGRGAQCAKDTALTAQDPRQVERLEREEREERERVEAEFERREGELRVLEERRRDLQKQAEARVQLVASNYELWREIQAEKKREVEQKRRLEQELKDLNRKKHEKQKKEWELQEKLRLRGRQEKEENEKRIREREKREKREKREREKLRSQITCAAKERNVNLPQGPGRLVPLPKAISKAKLPKEYEVIVTFTLLDRLQAFRKNFLENTRNVDRLQVFRETPRPPPWMVFLMLMATGPRPKQNPFFWLILDAGYTGHWTRCPKFFLF
jgi:hypothetical protein